MKQINLQATGVLDDLTHFRYATVLDIFLIKFAILCSSQLTIVSEIDPIKLPKYGKLNKKK